MVVDAIQMILKRTSAGKPVGYDSEVIYYIFPYLVYPVLYLQSATNPKTSKILSDVLGQIIAPNVTPFPRDSPCQWIDSVIQESHPILASVGSILSVYKLSAFKLWFFDPFFCQMNGTYSFLFTGIL